MNVQQFFRFPDPVNETSARIVVALGVVVQAVAFLVLREGWILVPLVYGFARSGPDRADGVAARSVLGAGRDAVRRASTSTSESRLVPGTAQAIRTGRRARLRRRRRRRMDVRRALARRMRCSPRSSSPRRSKRSPPSASGASPTRPSGAATTATTSASGCARRSRGRGSRSTPTRRWPRADLGHDRCPGPSAKHLTPHPPPVGDVGRRGRVVRQRSQRRSPIGPASTRGTLASASGHHTRRIVDASWRALAT